MHTSTKWTLGIITGGFTLGALILTLGWDTTPPLPYQWHKALHLLGVVLLMGNIFVTGMVLFMAEKTGERRIMAFGVQVVDWGDVWFTAPGGVLVGLNGLFMSGAHGGPGLRGLWGTPWLMTTLVLFSLSGIIWMVSMPLTQKVVALSQAGAPNTELSPEFFIALRRWYFFGTLATLSTLGAFFAMVLK